MWTGCNPRLNNPRNWSTFNWPDYSWFLQECFIAILRLFNKNWLCSNFPITIVSLGFVWLVQVNVSSFNFSFYPQLVFTWAFCFCYFSYHCQSSSLTIKNYRWKISTLFSKLESRNLWIIYIHHLNHYKSSNLLLDVHHGNDKLTWIMFIK